MKKAIVVGSAPVSLTLVSQDIDAYHKIAINKSWQLRRDFDSHVYLKSLPDEEHPPLAAGVTPIGVKHFGPVLRNAGGLYLTSGSVALVAGYWAIARLGLSYLSYFGCDLVFAKADNDGTHFYGSGDTGPLVGNFQYNLRQRERSIRLLCWGLLHNVVVSNSSGLDGSLLAFPKTARNVESSVLLDDIFSSKETLRLMRKSGNMWAHEMRLRTPVFRRVQREFEKDEKALAAMHSIMDAWAELEPVVQEYAARVEDLFHAAGRVGASQLLESPSQILTRQKSEFDLVLHVGAPHRASDALKNALSDSSRDEGGCKIVPQKDLKNYYTKLNTAFALKGEKDFENEKRNIQIVKNMSNRIFERLGIRPGDRVVISEEHALGSMSRCAFSGRLYRSSNKFLRNFAANLPAEPSEIHVTISNYADFFSEAYVRFLGSIQSDRYVSPDIMVAKVMARLPNWQESLEALPVCFPSATLHVWCVDETASLVPSLFNALRNSSRTEQIIKWQCKDHGFEMKRFAETLRRAGREAALEQWHRVPERIPSENTLFDPWTKDQRNHLDSLYQADLDRISQDGRFVFHPTEIQAKR